MSRYWYGFTPTHIVDGDTVDGVVDLGMDVSISQRLRLYGVNTPETRTKDPAEKKQGMKAKRFVEKALPLGEQVMIKTHQDRKGKFGRYLAEIYLPDASCLNKTLLEKGLAVEYLP